MKYSEWRRLFGGLSILLLIACFAAMAQSTSTQLSGTVLHVEGNQLVVRMSTGEIRTFTVPPGKTASIDGVETPLSGIKPGTTLNATVTRTTTTETERTVQRLSGKVWFAQGTTVILTLPNGTNRQFNVKDPNIKFKVDGRDATVFDLRKGMNVSAEKIVEEPVMHVAQESRVTGTAPRVQTASAPVPAKVDPAPTPAPAPVKAAPAPTPQPAAAPEPARLPKTASPIPFIGMLGGAFLATGLGLRQLRLRG